MLQRTSKNLTRIIRHNCCREYGRSLSTNRVAVVVGGAGSLGSNIINTFLNDNWTTVSVDVNHNENANTSYKVDPNISGKDWDEEINNLVENIKKQGGTGGGGCGAVIHCAGGFAMGDIHDGIGPIESMYNMNMRSAVTASSIGMS